MTKTAYNEFTNIVSKTAGKIEKANAAAFLKRVTIIADNPSSRALSLKVTKSIQPNDKIIFGTGDKLGMVTMSSDEKFVRASAAQGVNIPVYIHKSVPLKGK